MSRASLRARFAALPPDERIAFLRANSGLPGPRANLELLGAQADEGDAAWFDRLLGTDEEYLVAGGAVGLGRLLADGPDPALEQRLRGLAADGRWRVREAVATGLQRLGDADPARLRALADDWAGAADPLVQRAAVAAVCEPRLLKAAGAAAHAVGLCAAVTASLAARPAGTRRDPDVRTLRQALGYGWSVAVPAGGLPAFRSLDTGDPDLAWIVRENSRKARLSRLL